MHTFKSSHINQAFRITSMALVFIGISFQMQAQKKKQKVHYQYTNACLRIDKVPDKLLGPFDASHTLLFENDSLFMQVHFIELNEDIFPLPKACRQKNLVRIEIERDVECMYLLDVNKKALAACFPSGYDFELQWLSNGKNSMLKQWEMLSLNFDYEEDPDSGELYEVYPNKEILTRRIDRSGEPEDFELTITYFDTNKDKYIDKVITEANKN